MFSGRIFSNKIISPVVERFRHASVFPASSGDLIASAAQRMVSQVPPKDFDQHLKQIFDQYHSLYEDKSIPAELRDQAQVVKRYTQDLGEFNQRYMLAESIAKPGFSRQYSLIELMRPDHREFVLDEAARLLCGRPKLQSLLKSGAVELIISKSAYINKHEFDKFKNQLNSFYALVDYCHHGTQIFPVVNFANRICKSGVEGLRDAMKPIIDSVESGLLQLSRVDSFRRGPTIRLYKGMLLNSGEVKGLYDKVISKEAVNHFGWISTTTNLGSMYGDIRGRNAAFVFEKTPAVDVSQFNTDLTKNQSEAIILAKDVANTRIFDHTVLPQDVVNDILRFHGISPQNVFLIRPAS